MDFSRNLKANIIYKIIKVKHIFISQVYLLLKAALLQKFSVLDFSWGILATIPGIAFGIANILAGGRVTHHNSGSVQFHDAPLMPAGSGVSLGPVLFGGEGFSNFQHEFGHTMQNRVLGPLFYPLIAIPSLLSALRRNYYKHSQLYCERWADAWSPGYCKSNSWLSKTIPEQAR